MGGQAGEGKVHGNFYRDENVQPNKPELPRARRYKASKPLPKERICSRLGDVELTEQQEREWEAARQAEQHAREAEELAEEKRKLEAKAERLQNEQDAWTLRWQLCERRARRRARRRASKKSRTTQWRKSSKRSWRSWKRRVLLAGSSRPVVTSRSQQQR